MQDVGKSTSIGGMTGLFLATAWGVRVGPLSRSAEGWLVCLAGVWRLDGFSEVSACRYE